MPVRTQPHKGQNTNILHESCNKSIVIVVAIYSIVVALIFCRHRWFLTNGGHRGLAIPNLYLDRDILPALFDVWLYVRETSYDSTLSANALLCVRERLSSLFYNWVNSARFGCSNQKWRLNHTHSLILLESGLIPFPNMNLDTLNLSDLMHNSS